MLFFFNLHNFICKLYHNKTRKKFREKNLYARILHPSKLYITYGDRIKRIAVMPNLQKKLMSIYFLRKLHEIVLQNNKSEQTNDVLK